MRLFDRVWPLYHSSGHNANDFLAALLPTTPLAERTELAKELVWELRKMASTPEQIRTCKAKPTGQPAPGVLPLTAAAPLAPVQNLATAEDPRQLVSVWRKMQAQADHHTAEILRQRVKEILESPLDTFTPAELRQLAGALTDVQRIQRLALGLSPDNPGIPVRDELEEKGVEVRFVPRSRAS
jgi:hypothetical protein